MVLGRVKRKVMGELTGTVHMPVGRVWRGARKTLRCWYRPTTMLSIQMHADAV